jgi:dynactin complex subunit
MWAGIELDEAAGKNNGSIDGIPYFHCPPNYGMLINKNFLLCYIW